MNAVTREFEMVPAVRRAVALLIGLVGPSGSGKTFSALRIASGIQRVTGGEIAFIDTENGRALYYADKFSFKHVRFASPFSPDDYLAAIRYCVKQGAKVIVIDSMSHEHEGPGGVLEWHENEIERMLKAWKNSTREKVQMAAWAAPKQARRRMINELLQLNINVVATFRAKEKIKVRPGKDPEQLGWQPICGEELMFEMTLQALLLPGSQGRPTWNSNLESERAVMKLPLQFHALFDREHPAQLDEILGEKLARWASGAAAVDSPEVEKLLSEYSAAIGQAELADLEKRREALWPKIKGPDKQRLKQASDTAAARIKPANLDIVSLDQATWLTDLANESGVDVSLVAAQFEIGSLEELPSEQFARCKEFIEAEASKK